MSVNSNGDSVKDDTRGFRMTRAFVREDLKGKF